MQAKTRKAPHQCSPTLPSFQKCNRALKMEMLAYAVIGVTKLATLSLWMSYTHSVMRLKFAKFPRSILTFVKKTNFFWMLIFFQGAIHKE